MLTYSQLLVGFFCQFFCMFSGKKGKKAPVIKTVPFSPAEELYPAVTKWLCFHFPRVAFLLRASNWKSLVEILLGKANGFSHSYTSVTGYLKRCYLGTVNVICNTLRDVVGPLGFAQYGEQQQLHPLQLAGHPPSMICLPPLPENASEGG